MKSKIRKKVLVAGAGGFIGGHLAKSLHLEEDDLIICVDKKPLSEWYQRHDCVNLVVDLSVQEQCHELFHLTRPDEVYMLAADMGGMGFIEKNKALCMLSVLTSTNTLVASRNFGVKKFFYSSSACVYEASKQINPDVIPLRESDAYPAMPEDGYGWEKLFTERMCRHFKEDFGLETRVARYHNIFGPDGTWNGGREKAPAAICRKVIEAKITGNLEIEIWGSGEQTRSFTYIDDCVYGTRLIMGSDIDFPLNLGSSELVSINDLVSIVEEIAGIKLKRTYNLSAPKGVNGRNSDNSLIIQSLRWAPSTKLKDGLEKTYAWIYDQMTSKS